jgi:hypothetical protein
MGLYMAKVRTRIIFDFAIYLLTDFFIVNLSDFYTFDCTLEFVLQLITTRSYLYKKKIDLIT